MILWALYLCWVWYPRQWDLAESGTSWNQGKGGLNLKRSDFTESENLPKLVLYTNRGRVSGGPDLISRAYRNRQLGIFVRRFWQQRSLIQPGLRLREIRSREVSDHCRIRISSWIYFKVENNLEIKAGCLGAWRIKNTSASCYCTMTSLLSKIEVDLAANGD
jgi:hypothetical protein